MIHIKKLKQPEVSAIIGGLSYHTYLVMAGSIATAIIVDKSLKPHHRYELSNRTFFTMLQTARTVTSAAKTFCIIQTGHYIGLQLDKWSSKEPKEHS